ETIPCSMRDAERVVEYDAGSASECSIPECRTGVVYDAVVVDLEGEGGSAIAAVGAVVAPQLVIGNRIMAKYVSGAAVIINCGFIVAGIGEGGIFYVYRLVGTKGQRPLPRRESAIRAVVTAVRRYRLNETARGRYIAC